MNAEHLANVLIGLAKNNPGQAVGLVFEDNKLRIGLINWMVDKDDWFYKPVIVKLEEEPESIAPVVSSDPGGTRTLNQLIKSP